MIIDSYRGNVIRLPNPSSDENILSITLCSMVARKSRLPNPDRQSPIIIKLAEHTLQKAVLSV